ncbi:hypothetical protein BDU57DRAFT_531267 [Ampelomyces quisqualis]|uniref:Uncharacterized protein n=1 Tax=Ampelomyces quisqualis TaxID=50730 RepID=A0A6A5QLC5_AMPQU|nr:hypothetical protein BDU57DRAFT_531267 [Ampelomyces quisqualis]
MSVAIEHITSAIPLEIIVTLCLLHCEVTSGTVIVDAQCAVSRLRGRPSCSHHPADTVPHAHHARLSRTMSVNHTSNYRGYFMMCHVWPQKDSIEQPSTEAVPKRLFVLLPHSILPILSTQGLLTVPGTLYFELNPQLTAEEAENKQFCQTTHHPNGQHCGNTVATETRSNVKDGGLSTTASNPVCTDVKGVKRWQKGVSKAKSISKSVVHRVAQCHGTNELRGSRGGRRCAAVPRYPAGWAPSALVGFPGRAPTSVKGAQILKIRWEGHSTYRGLREENNP